MYSLDELKKQNQDISQLSDVLCVLMEKMELHDNPYVEELLEKFKEKVWIHLVFEDNTIYASLLKNNDPDTVSKAKTFCETAKEIRHRFSIFVKHWRVMANTSQEHEELRAECRDIFQMIRERIEYENNQIFPLIN